ncbi:MAG: 3-deoxy-D-manno-octulosonic acid transferase [Gemmataceae bacterium]
MNSLRDALYALILLLLAPWLLWRAWRRGRSLGSLWQRLQGRGLPEVLPTKGVWFHGVSVGEIGMLRPLVAAFRQRFPEVPVVVSCTTDTGLEQARKQFPDLVVFPFPFDFSWAIRRILQRLAPRLIVLAESELWPNFLALATERGVPVALVNGRMSPRSVRRYAWLRPLVGGVFRRLSLACVQTREQAAAYLSLGTPPGRVKVTGNIKYDGALTDRHNPRTRELVRLLGLQPGDRVLVAGSTQPGEELAVLAAFRFAQARHPRLKLIVAPRAPERFDEVAQLLPNPVRRSSLHEPLAECPPVVLLDTLGELAALYGLAEIAFVGGSLDGRRGGQSMIEPAAFGAAVLFGPHVWNFRHTASSLLELGAAYLVHDTAELSQTVERLLADEAERKEAGAAARAFVLMQQGATQRTLEELAGLFQAQAMQRAA